MADDTATEDTSATEETTEELGEGGKKALEAERKARADAEKRVKEYEAKLKEIDDRDKSDLQKALERAEAAERKAVENEVAALRATVAAEKGVLTSALTGSTKEELEAAADALIAWRDAQKKDPPKPKTLKSGAASGGTEDGRGRAAAALRQLRGAGN